MPRPSNTEERRAQIVEGLMLVLRERGYERASIAHIARAAGLTPGLVHYHFPSKQAVLLAVGEALDARFSARYERRLARAGDGPRAALHAFVDAHLALGDDASPVHVASWVALGAEASWQPEVGALYREKLEARRLLLRGLLLRALRAEGRSAARLDALAATVLACIEGFFQLATAAPGTVPEGSAARSARAMLDGLLDCRPSRRTQGDRP